MGVCLLPLAAGKCSAHVSGPGKRNDQHKEQKTCKTTHIMRKLFQNLVIDIFLQKSTPFPNTHYELKY